MAIQEPPLIDFLTPQTAGTRGLPVMRGAYVGTDQYRTGDIVSYEGSSWSARVSTLGNPPPSLPSTINNWWFLVAERGDTGSVGPAGATGPGFTNASVVGDNLIISKTDGSSFDAGEVRGFPGTDGADGSDGTSVLSGSGAPSAPAKDGDLYINAANGDLYKWVV